MAANICFLSPLLPLLVIGFFPAAMQFFETKRQQGNSERKCCFAAGKAPSFRLRLAGADWWNHKLKPCLGLSGLIAAVKLRAASVEAQRKCCESSWLALSSLRQNQSWLEFNESRHSQPCSAKTGHMFNSCLCITADIFTYFQLDSVGKNPF